MAKPMQSLWDIEPHTKAKHEILERYLDAWFPILATYNQRIIYLDGFCGPGPLQRRRRWLTCHCNQKSI